MSTPIPAEPLTTAREEARARLARARLYLCTDARGSAGELRRFARAAFAGGVDIIQVRDRSITALQELEALAIVRDEASAAGALSAANDRADLAAVSGVPVFHAGQDDIPAAQSRRIVPEALIGRSTHSKSQADAALADPNLDYFCVGPVWATPTKPGRPAVGPDLVRQAADAVAASSSPMPWFAIGGVDQTNLGELIDAGATRVVVVRAICDADDPEKAARRLRSALPA